MQDGADWFDSALSNSVDHPDGALPVPDPPGWSSGDDPSDSPGADRAGSRTAAAAADDDTSELWSSVRGRLLMAAVSVSMIASVVVLASWICLRSVTSRVATRPVIARTSRFLASLSRVLS